MTLHRQVCPENNRRCITQRHWRASQ